MIELIIIIVVALILFHLLKFMATPIIMAAFIGYMFGPEIAGYALLPLVALGVIFKATTGRNW